MKQKQFFIFAAAAALFVACSENDIAEKQSPQVQNEPGAVLFDVYTQRATTRAGVTGGLTTTLLKEVNSEFGKAGFGVFGYYTNSSTYDQQAIPNFFYNQQVKYDGSYFNYDPVKYWPNEYGTTAISEDADKVSFFAYAPYIDVVPATGKPTKEGNTPEENAELQKWGISSLSRNNATGDPLVKYIASFDQDKSVDLLWGVCDDTDWRIIQTGGIQGDLTKGMPWLNVQRPAEAKKINEASQKLKFTFKHATAQLQMNVDAFVDGLDATNPIASGTKVYVRSITLEGLATKGTLNLNNSEAGADKAYWLDYNGTNDLTTGESVTIYDGRKDGKEGTPSGVATNEKSLGLNPDLVQADIWANSAEGVTNKTKNLLRKYDETTKKYTVADQPIYVIPTGDPVKVTITYDIETADDNLSTYVSDVQQHGSSVENVITKEIDFGGTTILENGKSYIINLHLGMNSVKFDAAVTDWVTGSKADVDLPKNTPVASAMATDGGTSTTITVPAAGASGTFQVSGLTKGETATATLETVSGSVTLSNDRLVGENGIAEATYNITANNAISDITGTLTVEGGTSNKKAILNITQKAHALDLKAPTIDDTGKIITITSEASDMTDTDWTNATITVKKNGTDLTKKDTDPLSTGEFSITGSTATGTINLYDEAAAGDVYTITVDPGTGKAAAETVTLKIGGIAFAPAAYSIEYGTIGFKPDPTVYGNTPSGYSYTVTSSAPCASVNATSGEITTVKAGTPTTIQATATQSGGDFVYTTNSKIATYTLTVTKAIGTLSYTLAPKSGQTIEAGDVVIDDIKTAQLYNSRGDEITTKTISYSILSVDGVAGDGPFKIDGTALKVSSMLDNSTTYSVVIRATVSGDDDVTETMKDVTVTVTTVAP